MNLTGPSLVQSQISGENESQEQTIQPCKYICMFECVFKYKTLGICNI